MIYLKGQQVNSISVFSARFQSVLSMIAGGQEWLSWAIATQSVPPIMAAAEDQLLTTIQLGLNQEPYIRFNSFRAAIPKILSLPDMSIAQLASIRLTVNDNEANLAVLLQQNNMLSYGALAGSATFLAAVGGDRPDLFQAMSFEDQLAVAAFVQAQQPVDTALQSASYPFASQLAATVPDFINLCLFFQYVAQNVVPANLIPQTQTAETQAIYQQLTALIPYLLFTPNAGEGLDSSATVQAVPQLAKGATFIGYATETAAALNLVQNVQVSSQPDPTLQGRITTYLTAVKNIVSTVPAGSSTVSQDGSLVLVNYVSGQSQVTVGANRGGDVFIMPATKLST